MEQDKPKEEENNNSPKENSFFKNCINSYFTKEKRENFFEKVISIYHNYFIFLLCLVILILSWFLLNDYWVELIKTLLVDPISSQLPENLCIPSLFLSIMIIVYYVIVGVNEKRYNPKRFLFTFIIAVIYGLCFFSDNWDFYTPVEGSKILSYSNIIFIPFTLEFFFWLIRLCNGRKNIIDTSNQLELELICKEEKDDHFKRSDYIISISKILRNSFYEGSSFAIGINGSWGSGKSSFVEILKQKIEEQNIDKQKIVVIDYHPWNCKDPNDIIEDFFSMYRSKITIHIPELSPLIKKYSNALLDISSSKSSKFISSCIDLLNNDDTQSQYDKITNILKKSKLNVIITIDDLDRLDKNEIMEVLRLIRNSANFPYTQFIVAYDKDYVVKTLENNNIQKAEQYLEKIFNLEISLPKYQEKIICEELSKRISTIFGSVNTNDYIYKLIDDGNGRENNNYLIPTILRTKRDVIRFYNSLKLDFQPFIDDKKKYEEINLKDFFFIELLRYAFPTIYDILKYESSKILDIDNRNNRYNYIGLRLKKDDEEDFLTQLSNTNNEINITTLKIILRILFSNNGTGYNNEIWHIRSYYKYFSYQLDNECITKEDFFVMITNDNTLKNIEVKYNDIYNGEIERNLKYYISLINNREYLNNLNKKCTVITYKKIYSLIDELMKTEYLKLKYEVINSIYDHIKELNVLNIEQLKSLIELWMKMSEDITFQKENNINGYGLSIIMSLLYKENLKVKLHTNIIDDNIIDTIYDLLINTKVSNLITPLISDFINGFGQNNQTQLVVSIERLQKIQYHYFTNYILSIQEIDKKCVELFYYYILHIQKDETLNELFEEKNLTIKGMLNLKNYFKLFIHNNYQPYNPSIQGSIEYILNNDFVEEIKALDELILINDRVNKIIYPNRHLSEIDRLCLREIYYNLEGVPLNGLGLLIEIKEKIKRTGINV